jgi:hypothetical protein
LVCVLAVLAALPARPPRLGAGFLAACILLRLASIIYAWDHLAPRLDAEARAFAVLEPRSRVLPVVCLPAESKEYPERHFLAWAVIFREIYLPSLFADPTQQVLVLNTPCRFYPSVQASEVDVDAVVARECYDYIWVFNPAAKAVRIPSAFEQIYNADGVEVWRVR